jgi:hydrogenase-4 component E
VLYLAVGVLLLCAVGVVWRRQLAASVRLLAAQGVALAAIPVVSGCYERDAHLVAAGLAVGVLRAGLLPWLVSRLISRLVSRPAPDGATAVSTTLRSPLDLTESREAVPVVGTAAALLISAGLTVFAYGVSRPLVELDPSPATQAAPVALAVVGVGLLVLTTRRRAVSQIVGFLTLDNGIAALAFLLTSGVPLVVELGASLDLLLVVLVVATLASRMQLKFGGTDLGDLQELHE